MNNLIPFAEFCTEVCDEALTPAWEVCYGAADGLALAPKDAELFERSCGRQYRARKHRTVVTICGRNSQKTWSSLKRAVWRACFADAWITIRKGERPAVVYFAQDMRVAAEAMPYVKSLFQRPLLRGEVIDEKAAELYLRNGVIIRILPCSVRAPRGWRIFDATLDEAAMYETTDGASNQDTLVAQSIAPAMALFGDAAETRITSTPWRREGLVWDYYQRRGELADTIVWQADTCTMNPSFPAAEIERARREFGAEYVAREFLAEFTSDISGAFPPTDIDACVARGRVALPYQPGVKYRVAIDSAGGGMDSFTLAVSHRLAQAVVFDSLKAWSVRRQGLDLVLKEIKAILLMFQTFEVTGDQFSFDALAQLFTDRCMGRLTKLEGAGWTAENKQRLFVSFRVGLGAGQVELLDHAEGLRQLRSVEAVKASSGNVKFAARRGHDDLVSAMVLAHHLAKGAPSDKCQAFLAINGRISHGDSSDRFWIGNTSYPKTVIRGR